MFTAAQVTQKLFFLNFSKKSIKSILFFSVHYHLRQITKTAETARTIRHENEEKSKNARLT